jgi:hypothetical protein
VLTEENVAEGLSVFLVAGDELDEVPESHRGLVTPALADIFDDPPGYFLGVAGRCPFPRMAAWLRALVDEGAWALGLHRSFREEWNGAGFSWWSDAVQSAELTPSAGISPGQLPPALAEYYRLVDAVSWMPFGCAGGLYGRADHDPLVSFDKMYHGREAGVDPEATYVFGSAAGGDKLIYTEDGRGGWMGVENGRVRFIGTIEETIEWVYGELLANRSPDLDYGWLMTGS